MSPAMPAKKLLAFAAVAIILGGSPTATPAFAQAANTGVSANVGTRDVTEIRPLSNGLRQAICLAANPTGKGCKGGERKPDPQPQPGGRRR